MPKEKQNSTVVKLLKEKQLTNNVSTKAACIGYIDMQLGNAV